MKTSKKDIKNDNLSLKHVKILGIRVDSTTEEEVLRVIGQKMARREQTYIVTPNPEIILQAQKDKALAEIINKSTISVPDGSGLRLAEPNLYIIHGRKLMISLFELADKKKLRVFFITSNVLSTKDKLLARFRQEYPNTAVEAEVGPKINMHGQPDTDLDSKVNKDIVEKIGEFKPDFLFVCFGQSKQEKWIYENLPYLPVKMAIGVGGALDYYAGTKVLPPKWMEYLELEWLWRVFVEPGHLKRVFNAVIVFPIKVFLSNS